MVQNDISIKDGDYDSDPILLINKQSIEFHFGFYKLLVKGKVAISKSLLTC